MHIIFPSADNYTVSAGLFIAAWKVWFKRFGKEKLIWRDAPIPLHHADEPLWKRLEQGHRFSLDVLNRLMVPWQYRDRAQTTQVFFTSNAAFIQRVDWQDAASGETISAALLTPRALNFWDEIPFLVQDQLLNRAEARIQADIESPSDEPIVLDDGGVDIIGEDTYPPFIPHKEAGIEGYIDALVAWIHDDPFQPMYCRQPVGDPVLGWDERVKSYFWPKPRVTYARHCMVHEPIAFRADRLAAAIEEGRTWNATEQKIAVKVAKEVMEVAGDPQGGFTAEDVFDVFHAAIHADPDANAKLNSGWTRVAALATGHVENQPGRIPMIAWDSRVSTAVISRLDFLLVEAGHQSVPEYFAYIGTVPGCGGTRPRPLSLKWPEGYRRWPYQVAASKLVVAMRDILNNKRDEEGNRVYPLMPLPEGSETSDWTVWGVRRALFSDGY